MIETIEEIWKDPVGSNIIATIIFFLLSQIGIFFWGIFKKIGFFGVYKKIFTLVDKKISNYKKTKSENKITNNKNDKELIIYEAPTVFFHYRFGDAFPDLEYGYQWFTKKKDINNRLKVLLAQPLTFKKAKGYGVTTDPIWLFRSYGAIHIKNFRVLNRKKVLINNDELIIDKIAAYKGSSYYEDFVYIECLPDKPTGLYKHNNEYIKTLFNENRVYQEEYGIYKKHLVTRQEYDNGSAIIKGKPKKIFGVKLRRRTLTKYNFIISAKFSPYNSQIFEQYSGDYFGKLLREETSFDEFIDWMKTLPKNRNDY